MRSGNWRRQSLVSSQTADALPRQLCIPRGSGSYHDAEICHVLFAIPSGAGVSAAGAEVVPAGPGHLTAAGVYDALHRPLCKETVLHGNETTPQVLKESGKTSTIKSYMWVYRTSGCAEQPIVLYEYQPSRKAEHAQAFLKEFSCRLHADGYHGYHKPPENIRVVGCWAHASRKFDEALQTLPKEKRQKSLAAAGGCYCTQLFQLEQSLMELTGRKLYQVTGT